MGENTNDTAVHFLMERQHTIAGTEARLDVADTSFGVKAAKARGNGSGRGARTRRLIGGKTNSPCSSVRSDRIRGPLKSVPLLSVFGYLLAPPFSHAAEQFRA